MNALLPMTSLRVILFSDTRCGKSGALAVDYTVFPEMILPCGIVVGYVYYRLKFGSAQSVAYHLLYALHHQGAVAESEGDTIFHLSPVLAELIGFQRKEGEVYFGRHDRVPAAVE